MAAFFISDIDEALLSRLEVRANANGRCSLEAEARHLLASASRHHSNKIVRRAEA